MNTLIALSAAVVTVIFPLSGKTIDTDPHTARACILAVTGPDDSPPTELSAAWLWRKANGEYIYQCIRIQNEMAKKK